MSPKARNGKDARADRDGKPGRKPAKGGAAVDDGAGTIPPAAPVIVPAAGGSGLRRVVITGAGTINALGRDVTRLTIHVDGLRYQPGDLPATPQQDPDAVTTDDLAASGTDVA